MPTYGPLFIQGGGETGALIRDLDWSKTPIGPIDEWPSSLRSTVGTLLHSRHPMFLFWGPERIQFYNDAYTPSFGVGKHPAAMGQRAEDCWQEIWDDVMRPQLDDVMDRGIASYHEDQRMAVMRNGRMEEVFWTYGYSPVYGEDGIDGCLIVCTETTGRAVANRRIGCLYALGQVASRVTDTAAAFEGTADVLERYASDDVSFALMYTAGAEDAPTAVIGLEEDDAAALDAAIRGLLVHAVGSPKMTMPDSMTIQNARWPEPTRELAVICDRGAYFVFGVSPRLSLDSALIEFLAQIADTVMQLLNRLAADRAMASVELERDNLLMQSPVATSVLVGPELVYQVVNEPYRRLVNGRDVLGKPLLEAFSELRGTPFATAAFNCYRHGRSHAVEEMMIPLLADDGTVIEERYFAYNLEPLRDADDQVYGLMGVTMDITANVVARKQLEANQVEREGLVAELETASRAKDEFLARLGHELRNPLSPIMTALQLMRLRGDKEGERERAIIERQLTQVITLVDDLLDVSRIARGDLVLRKERLGIADVVRQAVEQASPLVDERRHRLVVELDEKLEVKGDGTRLAQVFANLVINAAKYTDPEGAITVVVRREGTNALVSVVDNGIGLSFDADLLFEAFTREDRNPSLGGLGLGLSIVKGLVAAHAGTIELRSAGEGCGTEARVLLPLTKARGDRSSHSSIPMPEQSTKVRRLLIVDDNQDAGELLGIALKRSGHEVRVVQDGASALELAKDFVPDVAFLDLGMPVMDGYALIRQLRQLPAWTNVMFVAVTGYGQASDRHRTKDAGFSEHFVKPVRLEEVAAAIQKSGGE